MVPPQDDRFGFSAAFGAELKKVGQITPQQFAGRYPAPKYLGELSFDPTTAKFTDQVNAEKVKKPGVKIDRGNGTFIEASAVELPGYKLNKDW